MRPCINQYSVMQCGLAEFIKICAEVGFKEVELRFNKVEDYLWACTPGNYFSLKPLSGSLAGFIRSLSSVITAPMLLVNLTGAWRPAS